MNRRLSLVLAALYGAAQAQFTAPGCPMVTQGEFRYVKVLTQTAGNLQEPLKLAFDRQGGNVDIYIVERHGNVKLYNGSTQAVSTLATIPVFDGGENGLSGIALDPGFKQNRWVYLFYAAPVPSEFRLSRFTLAGAKLDMASERILLHIPEERTVQHTGGSMEFDSYGDLWITVGKNASDHPNLISETVRKESCESSSSNAGDMRGGVLRIHPDDKAPKGYTIPAGNFGEYWSKYFADQGDAALAQEYTAKVLPEIYVKGTRNAYSISVDPVRRWMAWGEFGINQPTLTEEHNLVTHPIFGGFPYWSGNNYNVLEPDMEAIAGKKDPAKPMNNSKWNTGPRQLPPTQPAIHTYMRSGAITGPIYRYDGNLDSKVKFPPHFDKAWFTTDWHAPKNGAVIRIYSLSEDGTRLTDSLAWFGSYAVDHPIDLKAGPDGALYFVNYGAVGFGFDANTHIGKIEYTGSCQPTSLASSAQAAPELRLSGRILRVGETGKYRIKVKDCAGREVFSRTGSGPGEYSLAAPARGLYFATLETPRGTFTSALTSL